MQNQKGISSLIGIIIILAVAVVVFGGVFAYQYFTEKPQPAVQTQQNPTAGWKTYTNSIYNYQISYFPDAVISEMNGDITIQSNDKNGVITICAISDKTACGNFPAFAEGTAQEITREIIIDGKKYNLSGDVYDGGELFATYVSDNLFIYADVKDNKESGTEGKLLEMLSTFKFITPAGQTAGQNLSDQTIVDAMNKSQGINLEKNAQGKYQAGAPGGQSYYINSIYRGDLNGDGLQDAFVWWMGCGASCGSTFTVVINKNGVGSAFNVNPDGFETSGAAQYGVESITIDNGIITINADVYNGASTIIRPLKYKLVGENLIKI